MDASATFATVAAILIGGAMWIWMSKNFFSNDEKDKANLFTYTFHVETLRLFGFASFTIVMIIGSLITNHSGLETIPDPTDTVIYSIFQFNHSCNNVDHNPSKMIAAILLCPLTQLPMMMYCLLWHVRLAKAYRAGKVPKWLLNTSRILTPFNFITMAELHLWFVNGPQESYGFVAHYVPYLMFQLSIIFMMILNIAYLDAMNTLPFGIPSWAAWAYNVFVVIITFFCITFVITTLAGKQMFRDLVINYLSNAFLVCGIVGTIFFSYVESKDGNLLTLSVSDGVASIESADGRGGYGSVI
jgi:hypothetical protein